MYPADAEVDENFRLMSMEARGLYWTLLNHAWINDGLPESLDDIRELVRLSQKDFERLWVRVSRCFESVDGRHRNRRQEVERSEVRTKSESATKSVRTRYERTVNVPIRAIARALTSVSVSDSDSDSEDSKKESGKDFRRIQERWFCEELWPICWRKVDRAEALKSFLKQAVSEEAKNRIVTAAIKAAEVYLPRDADKRPHMSTWLNKKRFEDEAAEDPRGGEEEYDIRKAIRA